MSYRFLPIDEVIAEIGIDTDNEDSRDVLVYKQWVFRALRNISYSENQRKTVPLEASGSFSFVVPCDLAEPIQLNLLNNGSPLLFHWREGVGFVGERSCSITISEQNGFFEVSTNAGGTLTAEIQYWAMPVDEDGMPLTPEIFLEAVIAFCDWKWFARQRRRKPKEVSYNEVMACQQKFNLLATQAHGRAKLPNPMNAARIGRENLSRIPYLGRVPSAFSRRRVGGVINP